MISSLPEPLLCHILSFLTTEQAVQTSVLSSRWKHIWRWVPRLELDSSNFTDVKVCTDFIDKFLGFQGKSYLRELKLTIDYHVFDSDASLYKRCLGRVDMRKLERFQVENRCRFSSICYVDLPLTLSVCEALVCLKLRFVRLNDFASLSFPCLKIMYLEAVTFPSDAAAKALISCSPVLEVLKICLGKDDILVALRVCSLSLKSLTLKQAKRVYVRGRYSVVIDTPKLEYLNLMDHYELKSFDIISMADSVKVDLDLEFGLLSDYRSDMKVLYSLLNDFSRVGDVTMSWRTLQFICSLYYENPHPKFHGLTRLGATMCLTASPELLPIVLETCANLKHLTLELFLDYQWRRLSEFSTVLPRCLVSSLESVEMESPVTEKATELKLARYFLKNSTKLKKLVLRLNQSSTGKNHKPGVLEQLIEYPRRSSLCQFEVIPVFPTPNHPLPDGGVYVNSNRIVKN
ncbi:F-box/FBD/LRR-repeat protein [Raphanus sativus]|nr:F-box/FBD/LRR-repeat protein [Raphanus sativus]